MIPVLTARIICISASSEVSGVVCCCTAGIQDGGSWIYSEVGSKTGIDESKPWYERRLVLRHLWVQLWRQTRSYLMARPMNDSILLDDRFTNTLTLKFKLTEYRFDHIDLDQERTKILGKSTRGHSMFDTVLPLAVVKKRGKAEENDLVFLSKDSTRIMCSTEKMNRSRATSFSSLMTTIIRVTFPYMYISIQTQGETHQVFQPINWRVRVHHE